MKNNALWLALLLTAALGVTGCNDSAKQDNNDKLISAAPISNEYADFLVKWRNKDEDSDGILDELDDYPGNGGRAYELLIVMHTQTEPLKFEFGGLYQMQSLGKQIADFCNIPFLNQLD